MAEQIHLRAEELERACSIDLRTDEAPETCDALLEALPLEGAFVNGKFSGEEVFTELGDDALVGLDPENWEYDVVPGDVGYWYSHWGDDRYERGKDEFAELVIVYGRRVRIRKGADRVSAINLVGSVAENLEELSSLCGRIQREGAKTFRLERA